MESGGPGSGSGLGAGSGKSESRTVPSCDMQWCGLASYPGREERGGKGLT